MSGTFFSSYLAEHLSAYLALRRSLGCETGTLSYLLRQFDGVVAKQTHSPRPVSREIVEEYLRSLAHLQPTTRRLRLSVIRQFLFYLRRFEPATFVPDHSMGPTRPEPRKPCIFTENEMRALIRAAYSYPRRQRYGCWLLYPTLFGLLYVTGMRVSEALALKLDDIDLAQSVLWIRRTKFHKSRLIPLAGSSCLALRRYLSARAERGHQTTPDAFLFVNNGGKRIPYYSVREAFHVVTRKAGIELGSRHRPKIHDLRHTAAVRRLYSWYKEGKNVQALLPVLVTYLGHSSVSGTAIYLTTTAELLAEASARFEKNFDLQPEGKKGGSQ
jgi:site-specific recombinase XerD